MNKRRKLFAALSGGALTAPPDAFAQRRIGFFHSMSLKARILFWVLVLLGAGIWGLAARTVAVLQTDLEQLLSDQMSATVGYVAADLDSKVRLRIDTLNEVAASITPGILGDPARTQRVLELHQVSTALFPVGILVINRDGTSIADHPRLEGRVGGSLGSRAWFQEIMAGRKYGIGPPVIGRFAKQRLVSIAVPVRDADGTAVGAVVGSIHPDEQNMFGQLEQTKLGRSGNFLVVSAKERLIVSATDKSRIMQALSAKGVNPLLDRRIEEGYEGKGIVTTPPGREVLTVNRNMKTTGWIVIAGMSTEEAFAPIVTLRHQIYLTALLMTLVIIAILRFLLARQLAPLKEAGARMQCMTDGTEPFAPLPIIRNDEIGRLVGNFNRLATERIRLDESLREEITKRKQSEETRANLAAIVEGSHDAIIGRALDAGGTITSWNAAAERIFGYSASEAIGQSINILTPPEWLRRIAANNQDLRRGIVIPAREAERITKDGRIINVMLSLSPVRNEAGEVVSAALIIRDISELKQAEETQARLAAIVENADDAIIGRALDGTITSWNAAAERLYGYSAAEAIGSKLQMAPSDLQEEVTANREQLKDGQTVLSYETARVTKDGRRIEVSRSMSPIKDKSGNTIGMAAIVRDITQRKRAEAQLRLAASVFDNALDGIMITDENFRIVAVNRAFTDITGYAAAEAIGNSPRMLRSGHHDDEFYQTMRHAISDTGNWQGEIWDKRKNGDLYCEHLSISAVRGERGEITNYCAVFADITPRKTAETELLRLNAELEARVAERTQELERANRELETFSYSVSHDLRAPLRHILGFSAMVVKANEGKLGSASVDHLGKIAAGAQRMAELIDDLLQLSHISRQEMRWRPFNLSELSAKVIQVLAQAHPQRNVEVVIAPAMTIEGDRGLMQIAMENLLGNAWKFTSHTEHARIEVGCTERDGEPIYFVRDNGAGFDMKYAAKLFGAFQRLHSAEEFEGSGIGLSIVQRIIVRHAGRVWVEAAAGEGATFYFTLGKNG